jgi:zinc protease
MGQQHPLALSSAVRRVSKGLRASFDTRPRFARRLLRTSGIFATLCFLLILAALPAGAVEIKPVKSPGGILAWLVEDHTVPVVSISVAFRGGAALDPPDKGGLAEMTSDLLDEGAGDLDSQAIQKAVEDISAQMSFGAGRDNFSASLRTLASERDRAFALFRLALTAPRFDAEPVTRVRAQILASIRQGQEQPNRIASETWSATVFPGHPYGQPTRGTLESVPKITPDDMRGFVKTRLARSDMYIGVVGDIKADELARRLDEIFEGLPTDSQAAPVPEAAMAGQGKLIVIKKPIPQSVAIFGEKGLKRADPDWYAAVVMNRIFGEGGFASRLMEEVREKRGLAYGVSTTLQPMDHAALLVGQVATRSAQIKESLDIIRAEWKRMAENGATPTELENAKTYINGSFPLRLDSSGRIAGLLVSIQLDKLGIDYLDRRDGLINAVTLADVGRVAKRLLDVDALTTVVVGEPEGLSPNP